MIRISVAESKQQQKKPQKPQYSQKRISVYNDMVTILFHQQLEELLQLSSIKRIKKISRKTEFTLS